MNTFWNDRRLPIKITVANWKLVVLYDPKNTLEERDSWFEFVNHVKETGQAKLVEQRRSYVSVEYGMIETFEFRNLRSPDVTFFDFDNQVELEFIYESYHSCSHPIRLPLSNVFGITSANPLRRYLAWQPESIKL